MEIQEAYQEKMAAQLKEWSTQINLLEAKLDNVSADMKIKRAGKLRELRAKHTAASEKITELGNATGEAWEQIKVTADKIWDDLKVGITEAHAKFK